MREPSNIRQALARVFRVYGKDGVRLGELKNGTVSCFGTLTKKGKHRYELSAADAGYSKVLLYQRERAWPDRLELASEETYNGQPIVTLCLYAAWHRRSAMLLVMTGTLVEYADKDDRVDIIDHRSLIVGFPYACFCEKMAEALGAPATRALYALLKQAAPKKTNE